MTYRKHRLLISIFFTSVSHRKVIFDLIAGIADTWAEGAARNDKGRNEPKIEQRTKSYEAVQMLELENFSIYNENI